MFKHPTTWFFRVFGLCQALIIVLALCQSAKAQDAGGSLSSDAVASIVSQKRPGKASAPAQEDQVKAPKSRSSVPKPQAPKADPEPAVMQQIQPSIEEDETPAADDGSQDEMSAPPEGESLLKVRISVPHHTRAVSTITLYPYPPRPPKMYRPTLKIHDDAKSIRGQLLNLGYSNRSSDTKLFPHGGWRWHYVLNAAYKKSGSRPPTNIMTMYPWTFKMVPYVRAEIRRINEIEHDRNLRYLVMMKDFDENGVELENEAVQKGLSPVEIKMKKGTLKLLSGVAAISPGTWYIVAAHKTSNLKFYWQIPVTVAEGEKAAVELTQTNALVIEGDW